MRCSAPYDDAARIKGALWRGTIMSAPEHPCVPLSSVAILLTGQQLERGHLAGRMSVPQVEEALYNACDCFSREAAPKSQEFRSSCNERRIGPA